MDDTDSTRAVPPGPPGAGAPADEPEVTTPAPPRRARRTPRTALTIVLLAITIGASAVAWQQRETAAGWQARADVLEQQRDDAIGRSEALSGQLSELAGLVELSVDELATLEERLAELAGEKAQAEDRATLTRDELRTLAARVDTAVRSLNACADDLLILQADTVAAFNALARRESVDVAPLQRRLDDVNARCREARQAGEAAVALASRLR